MIDLVLVHAFPLDGRMWEDQVRGLSARARVHAPDLPGFGAAGGVPARTIDEMAAAVRGYVLARGLSRFVLGGLSMGGYVALAYLRRHGFDGVAGLVLADTKAGPDTEDGRRGRDENARLVREQGTAAFVAKMMPKMLAPGAAPDVVARARAIQESQPAEATAQALEAMRDRADSTPLLATVPVPALVLFGDRDALTPPDLGRDIVSRLPGAQLRLIPGAGHLSNMENAAEFNRALGEFVAGL